MKWVLMLIVAISLSAFGTAISDTFVCGFIAGVIALDINSAIERGMA